MPVFAAAKTGKTTPVTAIQRLFLAAAGKQFLSFFKDIRKTCEQVIAWQKTVSGITVLER